jgi:phosphodiesterase/alkaline phosphatase D-like protein
MISDDADGLTLSRRRLLAAAGITAAASLLPSAPAHAAALDSSRGNAVTAPPVSGLHLQFGADASSSAVVSWHTLQRVANPRVLIGDLDGRLLQKIEAREASYTDAKSKQAVYAYHAAIHGLKPNVAVMYCALHDGAAPAFGSFRTAPRGRAAFTFTSFGDQGTPTLGRT